MLNMNPDESKTQHATSLTMQSGGIGPYFTCFTFFKM